FSGRLRGNRVQIPSGPATVTGIDRGLRPLRCCVGRPWSKSRRKPGNLPASEGTYTPSGQRCVWNSAGDDSVSSRLSVPARAWAGFFLWPPALRAAAGPRRRPSAPVRGRSEEHTSELSHVKTSYAVFCLTEKTAR